MMTNTHSTRDKRNTSSSNKLYVIKIKESDKIYNNNKPGCIYICMSLTTGEMMKCKFKQSYTSQPDMIGQQSNEYWETDDIDR